MITTAPTGISWSIIPFPKSSTAQQRAEQMNMCHRATAMVDGEINQTLRSTVDTEVQQGPNYYITIDNSTGQARWILTRSPVTQILAAQSAPNVLPPIWQPITQGAWRIDMPVLGVYGSYTSGGSGGSGGQTIYLGIGSSGWWNGRNGYLLSATYLNGWPHSGLTASCAAGSSTLTVDDVTGMAGASVKIYDGTFTEDVHVVSAAAVTPLVLPNGGGIAQAGPGTLTLASPTMFAHTGANPAEVVVSAIPGNLLWATILATTVQALESGITAVTIQNLPGSQTMGGQGIAELEQEYKSILRPYRRVI
jgi:hypothetical protein